jgi:endonuclease III
MKNATAYEKKIRKLLASMPKKSVPEAPKELEAFTLLLEGILGADVPRKAAAGVLNELHTEFVDYNELRVAPVKDITDCMPREFWGAREKAESIVRSLNAIFDRSSRMTMEHLEKMPKRDLRKYLGEVGLSTYAAALVTLVVFGGHAVPVDQALVDALEIEELVHPGSTVDDVQGFLERVIGQKEDYAAHEFFRDFVEKNYKAVLKKLKEHPVIYVPPPPPPPEIAKPIRPGDIKEELEADEAESNEAKAALKARSPRSGKPVKPGKPTGRK